MNNLIQEKPTAEQVKVLRLKAGLSQTAFAELIGLSNRQLIGDYETGKKTPSSQTWTLMLLATNQHPNLNIKEKVMFKLFQIAKDYKTGDIVYIDTVYDKLKNGLRLIFTSQDLETVVKQVKESESWQRFMSISKNEENAIIANENWKRFVDVCEENKLNPVAELQSLINYSQNATVFRTSYDTAYKAMIKQSHTDDYSEFVSYYKDGLDIMQKVEVEDLDNSHLKEILAVW